MIQKQEIIVLNFGVKNRRENIYSAKSERDRNESTTSSNVSMQSKNAEKRNSPTSAKKEMTGRSLSVFALSMKNINKSIVLRFSIGVQ